MCSVLAHRAAHRGFTLIELLVVVPIIALLISILLPSLSKARETARMVKCQANQKQFGSAHHMYANGADDWFVPVEISGFGGWYRWIQWRQIMGLRPGNNWPDELVCPQVPADRRHIVQFNVGVNGTAGSGLAAQANSPWRTGDRAVASTATGSGNMMRVFRGKVRNPSAKYHMGDSQAWRTSRPAADYITRWDLFPELNPNAANPFKDGTIHASSYRHNEGANVLMYDGHVEYRPKTEVFYYNASGTPNNNKNNDLWVAYR